ncbi:YncE family protein [Pseudomonas lurida]|uniref:YncE family protein n=1 Tax=Pseudomonas lurida TaxID=244566 RepID=UPI003D29B5B4
MSLDSHLTDPQPNQLPMVMPLQPHDHYKDLQDIDLSEPQRLLPQYFMPAQATHAVKTAQDFVNVPFAELPLYIPGMTQNVEGFDGGINNAALAVHLDNGLLCNLLPYLNMAALDFVELFCVDTITPVATYSITEEDANTGRIIPLYIPRTRLTDGPVSPVFMRVTSIGGNTNETARFRLKVDTVRPGGRNPVASTLQNENLPKPLFPQEIIDFGVSEADAQRGVTVTFKFYPVDDTQAPSTYRAARDRIRLSVGGVFAPIQPLTVDQASGRDDISVVLYYGFWQQVGSGSRVCEYEIIDEVGNASDGWSPAQLLNVQINDGTEPLLPAAFILEAPSGSLDHDALNGAPANFFINTPSPDFIAGDIVRVTVNGRAADGSALITTYDSSALVGASFVIIPGPNADLRKLIGGRLQLSYERIRRDVPNRGSLGTIVEVIGTPIETGLQRPIIIDANNGVLDPQLLFVNVGVPVYEGRQAFDLVTLILDGTYANGDRYYREFDKAAGTGAILFKLNNGPNGEIAKLEGGTLRFLYKVTNEIGTRTSLDETVNVGHAVASLPEPLVEEAPPPQYQFDPAVSTGDAQVVVKSHSDFKAGDTVVLYCEGTAAGGTQPPIRFPILGFWVDRDLPFTLERRYITPNINQSMRIYYTRERDHALTRMSQTVTMGVGSRLVLQAPTVVEATVIGTDIASINPLNVLPPQPPVVTIRVVVDHLPPSADIKLFIVGKPGVGTPDIAAKPARPEPGTNYVSFTVQNNFVGAYLGEACKVFYNLVEIGKSTKSDELTLQVEALPAHAFDLVSIPEALDGVINTTATNTVRIDKWPFFRAGLAVWIDLDSNVDFKLRPGNTVTAAEVSAGRTLDQIPADYLEQLNNDDEVSVKAWVSLDGSNSLETATYFGVRSYRVRKSTGEIVREIVVGNSPTKIVIHKDGSRACVVNSGDRTVAVIDLSTYGVRTVNYGATINALALHPTDSRLFITGEKFSGTTFYITSVVNTDTLAQIYQIANYIPFGMCSVSPDGSRLFLGSTDISSTVAASGRHTHNYAPAKTYSGTASPNAATTNPLGSAIFFTGTATERFVLDTAVRTHSIGNGTARELAHSPYNANSERLYVSVSTANRVDIYDTSNDGLNFINILTGINNPRGIAFHPTQPLAYVAELNNNRVSVIDTINETLVGTINGFAQPDGLACTPDGKTLLVCNSGTNTVTVVSI